MIRHWNNSLRIAAIGLFMYMPFHILLSQWLSTYTGGLDVWKLAKDGLTALVTILCIATVMWRGRQTRTYLFLLGGVAVYAFLHLLLIALIDTPSEAEILAFIYNLRIFAYVIIGFSLALLLPKSSNLLPRLTKLLIILSTIVCLVAMLQWLLPKDLMTNFGYSIERGVKPNFFIDDKPDLPRVFSTLRDPNSLGAFLILPIVLLGQKLVAGWRTNRRMLLSGLLLLHLLVLFLTFSRSTLLATLLALSVLFLLQNRAFISKNFTKIAAIGGALLIITIGSVVAMRDNYLVSNLVFHADESTELADPNELRVMLFQEGVEGVVDEPLGNGPGTAGLPSTRIPDGLLTENYFLQIAYEVGIIGLIVFLALLYLIVRRLWAQRNKPLAQALLASFAGLVFANLLFHTWANEAVAISWFLLAGLLLVKRN